MEMAILDVIKSRREITKFEERKILDEVMEEILDAAYYAPTGNNLLSRNLSLSRIEGNWINWRAQRHL